MPKLYIRCHHRRGRVVCNKNISHEGVGGSPLPSRWRATQFGNRL